MCRIYLSIWHSTNVDPCLSVCHWAGLSVRLSLRPYASLSKSICLSVRLSVSLSANTNTHTYTHTHTGKGDYLIQYRCEFPTCLPHRDPNNTLCYCVQHKSGRVERYFYITVIPLFMNQGLLHGFMPIQRQYNNIWCFQQLTFMLRIRCLTTLYIRNSYKCLPTALMWRLCYLVCF